MSSFVRLCCIAIAAFALSLVFAAGHRAAAQTPEDAPPPIFPADPNPPRAYTLNFDGIETAAGAPDYSQNQLVGLNYAGGVSGAMTGAFSFVLKQNGIETDPKNGNELLGDTWSLVVIKGGQSIGILYGAVVKGSLNPNSDGSVYVKGDLTIKGGTGAFANVTKSQGSGYFELLRTVNGDAAPTLTGNIVLTF